MPNVKCPRCNGTGEVDEGTVDPDRPYICPAKDGGGRRCVRGINHEGGHCFEDDFVIPAG